MRRTTEARLRRLQEIQAELDARRALYEEYDRLVLELAREGFRTTALGELIFTLEDKFSGECNTGWTSAAVKRYEMRIETADQVARRARRAEARRRNE